MCTLVQCACGLHRQQHNVSCCFPGALRLAQYARWDIHLQETLEYKRKLYRYKELWYTNFIHVNACLLTLHGKRIASYHSKSALAHRMCKGPKIHSSH